jgi:hypothetical protein
MKMDITSIIGLLGAMSLSVERVVEIIKDMIPQLAVERKSATWERWRRIGLHALAAFVGTIIALAAQEQIQPLLSPIFNGGEGIGIPGCIMLGLLSSGGSGFWNHSLSIVEEIRNTKRSQAKKLKAEEPQK